MDSLLNRVPNPIMKAPNMISAIPTLSGPPIFFFFFLRGGGDDDDDDDAAGLLSTI